MSSSSTSRTSPKTERQAVNGSARAILQGRKYGYGCVLVTQRTANVTKSILNPVQPGLRHARLRRHGHGVPRELLGRPTLRSSHPSATGRPSSSGVPPPATRQSSSTSTTRRLLTSTTGLRERIRFPRRSLPSQRLPTSQSPTHWRNLSNLSRLPTTSPSSNWGTRLARRPPDGDADLLVAMVRRRIRHTEASRQPRQPVQRLPRANRRAAARTRRPPLGRGRLAVRRFRCRRRRSSRRSPRSSPR